MAGWNRQSQVCRGMTGEAAVVAVDGCTLAVSKTMTHRGSPLVNDRAMRVMAMTCLIALLSVVDLIITMIYLRNIGMSEANPIARLVMSYNSPMVLAAWKIGTIIVSSTIFFLGRRLKVTEAACWICLGAMLWLTGQWVVYIREVELVTPVMHMMASGETGQWVSMAEQPAQ